MKKILSFVFLAIASIALGGDLKYPVSEIPEALKKDVNAVVREDKMVYKILAQNRASVSAYYAVTIFNERGKDYASTDVDYDKLSKVTSISGSAYDATGKLIKKLKNSEIIDHSAYEGLYSDSRAKSIDLAQSIYPYTVVIEYEKQYNFLYMIDGTFIVPDEKVSVQYFSYQLIYPRDLAPRYKSLNIDIKPRAGTTADGFESLTWEFRDVMPIKFEPLSSWRDVVPQIKAAPTKFEYDGYVGSMKTWGEYGAWQILVNTGKNDLPESTKQKVKGLTEGATTIEAKAKIIYEFLQNKTRYVSIQDGIGGLQPFPASVVDQVGYGDCKALSNYTVALLNEVGVKGYYTKIRAGANMPGLNLDLPSHQTNHIIVAVPNGKDTLWLECTSQTNPFGYLGSFTNDRYALMITEDGGKIVKTPDYTAEHNVQSTTAKVFVQADGNAKAKVSTTYAGLQYENGGLDRFVTTQGEDQKKWIQRNTGIPSFDINSFSMVNHKSKIPSAVVNIDLTLNRFATVSGKRLFLTPNLMNRSTYIPEKVENRKTNVVRRMAYTDIDTIRYQLPEEIYPEFLPAPIAHKSRFGEYEASFKIDQGSLLYIRKIKMNKGEFPPDSYNELIEFYKNVNKADQVKMVFMNKT